MEWYVVLILLPSIMKRQRKILVKKHQRDTWNCNSGASATTGEDNTPTFDAYFGKMPHGIQKRLEGYSNDFSIPYYW